jgi:hypothetical protein
MLFVIAYQNILNDTVIKRERKKKEKPVKAFDCSTIIITKIIISTKLNNKMEFEIFVIKPNVNNVNFGFRDRPKSYIKLQQQEQEIK